MTRADAKKIVDTITLEQLVAMFERAKASITDWTAPSKVNPGVSLGAAWNLYYPCLVKKMSPCNLRLTRVNMLVLFGDYLDEALKPPKRQRLPRPAITVFHQEPIFEVKA